MYYEIAEVSRDQDSGRIYVLVQAWRSQAEHDAGDPAFASNDFLLKLRRQYQRVVTDANGRLKRVDGVFVAPGAITPEDKAIGWERETVTKTNAELRQEVVQHIRAYIRRFRQRENTERAYPRKHDNRERIVRVLSDPDGLLSRVSALQGQAEEVAD